MDKRWKILVKITTFWQYTKRILLIIVIRNLNKFFFNLINDCFVVTERINNVRKVRKHREFVTLFKKKIIESSFSCVKSNFHLEIRKTIVISTRNTQDPLFDSWIFLGTYIASLWGLYLKIIYLVVCYGIFQHIHP